MTTLSDLWLDLALGAEQARKQVRAAKARAEWEERAERRLQRRLATMFRRAEREVVAAVADAGVPATEAGRRALLGAVSALTDEVGETMASIASEGAVHGANAVVSQLQQAGASISFSQPNPNVALEIAERAFVASEATMATVVGDVNAALVQVYEEGLHPSQAVRHLRNVFQGISRQHAAMIARTEIQSAKNLASYRVLQQLGIRYHRWNATPDDRTRPTHLEQHGLIVRVGDRYPNGLLYPGDRTGPMKEWVACRCRESAFLMPAGWTAPPGRGAFRESNLVRAAPEPVRATVRPPMPARRSL